MRIAICDDNLRELERLIQVLTDYKSECDSTLEFCSFQNGLDLLSGMKGGEYDAVFLDVCMPGFSGIQTAQELRTMDKNVKIVFLTVSPEFAVESYSVGAYHYLIKPASRQMLFPLLDKLKADLCFQDEQGLLIKGRDGVVQIPFNRLEYVEVMNKTVSFHLIDGSVRELSAALADFESALLAHSEFLKVHRSYLLNLRHVQSIGAKGAITKLGHTIPISRSAYTQVKDLYMHFLFQSSKDTPIIEVTAPPKPQIEQHFSSPWRIILVDDDLSECSIWAERLLMHGCIVDTAQNEEEALAFVDLSPCDCVILDVMLTNNTSFELCKKMRDLTNAPIVFLSSHDDCEHQLSAFAAGGIDYISKSTPAELFWKKIETRIMLSRSGRTQLRFGPLLLDLSRRKAFVLDSELILTPTEFDLLWLLAEHAPRVYTHEELYHTVWGTQQWDGGQTVQVHMSRLRRKLEKAYPRHYFIETVWAKGYRFSPLTGE